VVLVGCLLGWLGFYDLAKQIGTFSNLPPMLLMSIMVVYSQTLASLTSNTKSQSIPIEKEDKHFNPSDEQKSKLDDLMLRVKIYQDPELRLDGLADCMKMSPRSVSALLNGYYQKNFYDFVNYYRVLDAQEQLRNTRTTDKTIQRIFEDAGFNSKTTFNTLFKKLTGHTPSEYRKIASVSVE
jgi:AraC-like DNA-binding protein